uniref:Reverse transcriptase domain-containing protein n=1 Tax=Octopus bimaculoides TaxID=37653 RepID=A0A0L8GPG0_OCTBM
MKAKFDHMLKLGLIRPSTSPLFSLLHLIQKGSTDFHPVGDNRRLNAITIPDRCPILLCRICFPPCMDAPFFPRLTSSRHIKFLSTRMIYQKLLSLHLLVPA